jgi:UDP-N-acetylmuramyl pentapeptide synthase
MNAVLVVDDVENSLDGARVWLRLGDELAVLQLDAIGDLAVERALRSVEEALASGMRLADAISAGESIQDIPRRCQRRRLGNGVTLIDDTEAVMAADVRRSLKVLADVTRGTTRSFAVVGEMRSEPNEWFDDHDQLGRLVVRLDISQFIVVGQGARHASTAAGLEGSWDGESILVDDVNAAYDELRNRLRPGDVVLISAAGVTPLDTLLERLTEESR